jgi:hypothetical protein
VSIKIENKKNINSWKLLYNKFIEIKMINVMNTNGLRILGLGLLLGIKSSAVAEVARDLTDALNLLKSREITVGDIYTEADIDLAWHGEFKPITQNVVRVNAVDIENGLKLPSIGTGTLIDIGIPDLAGKVVITCAHCASIDPWASQTIFNNDTNGTFRGKFNINGKITYLSVTPECVCTQNPKGSALINTIENYRADLITGKAIAITDVYVFPGKDFCVMILEKPVTFNQQIVPGIPLSNLNVINDILVNEAVHVKTTFDETPIVIGYGYTGVQGLLDGNIFGSLEDCVRNNKLRERQDFLIALGWNIKKAIRLRGIDAAWGTNFSGCNCKTMQAGNEEQYAYTMAGGGFSGSLVIKGKGERPDNYNVYGIFSGPQWTQELKNFIRNAGERFLNGQRTE